MFWYRRNKLTFGSEEVVNAPNVFVKLIRDRVDEILSAQSCNYLMM